MLSISGIWSSWGIRLLWVLLGSWSSLLHRVLSVVAWCTANGACRASLWVGYASLASAFSVQPECREDDGCNEEEEFKDNKGHVSLDFTADALIAVAVAKNKLKLVGESSKGDEPEDKQEHVDAESDYRSNEGWQDEECDE